ncbi:hypothetical protein HAX54_050816, partial [Datura stramonium]|nr:hypothetical protein [Datura stramonium]
MAQQNRLGFFSSPKLTLTRGHRPDDPNCYWGLNDVASSDTLPPTAISWPRKLVRYSATCLSSSLISL